MGEFENKLNEVLGSPETMEQIMRIARSLSGGGGGGGGDEQRSSGTQGRSGPVNAAPKPGPADQFAGIDPKLMGLFEAVLKEYGSPSDKTAVINALKPYLKSDRREKVDKAIQIAKLAKVAKTMIPELGGTRNV